MPTSWQRALYLPLIILAWLTVVVAAGWLLSHVTKTILVLVISAVIAFALTPLVHLLSRWLPRGLAIGVAYLVGFGIVLGLGALLVVDISAQATNLVKDLPNYLDKLKHFEPQIVNKLQPFGVTQAKINSVQQQAVSRLQSIGSTAATGSLGLVSGVLSTAVDAVLVLILSVYFTANGPNISRRLRAETPRTQRWRTGLMIAIVNQVVGGYIRGTITMAALIGTLVGGGLFVLHVPYAALLGVLAFFMEFIPIIGVLISGAVSVGIALFSGWVLALVVLGYFVIVHILEGDVIGPRVMGKAVGIHPATALVALVAGMELFGFWGALFGAPLAGLLQAIGTAAWREMRGGDPQAVTHAVLDKEKEEQVREQRLREAQAS